MSDTQRLGLEDRRLGILSRLNAVRIGPMPLPTYLVLVAITLTAVFTGHLPKDIIGGLSVMLLLGFLLGEIGQRAPILRQIGGTAILCLFVPAALVGYGLIPQGAYDAVFATFKTTNLQYFFIACLVAGSILGMPHRVLIEGFAKMFVPLVIGTVGALAAGVSVGMLFGYSPAHTYFFIITPIIGGGLAEGVLPLSIAYSEIMQQPQDQLVAMMVPAAVLGNVVAIVSSGLLHRLGQRKRHLSGDGMLVKSGDDNILNAATRIDRPLELRLMGAGLLLACGFFLLGHILATVTGIPGPILMIVSAALIKVANILPDEMEAGAFQIGKFMSTNLTFGILVAMGVILVSWDQLVASLTLGYIAICTTTVLAMIASGYFIANRLNMYPVESAIVTACHSGLGGTGDVAILSASERMGLMPFAQISTRIGGAIMIVIATVAAKAFYG